MNTDKLKQYLQIVVKQVVKQDGVDPHEKLLTVMQSLNPELMKTVRSNKNLSKRLAEELNKAWFQEKYYGTETDRNVQFKPFTLKEIYSPKVLNSKLQKKAADLTKLSSELWHEVSGQPPAEIDVRPRFSKAFMFMKHAAAQHHREDLEEHAEEVLHKQAAAAVREYEREYYATEKAYEEAVQTRDELLEELAAYTSIPEIRKLASAYSDKVPSMKELSQVVPKENRYGKREQLITMYKEASIRARRLEDKIRKMFEGQI